MGGDEHSRDRGRSKEGEADLNAVHGEHDGVLRNASLREKMTQSRTIQPTSKGGETYESTCEHVDL